MGRTRLSFASTVLLDADDIPTSNKCQTEKYANSRDNRLQNLRIGAKGQYAQIFRMTTQAPSKARNNRPQQQSASEHKSDMRNTQPNIPPRINSPLDPPYSPP